MKQSMFDTALEDVLGCFDKEALGKIVSVGADEDLEMS